MQETSEFCIETAIDWMDIWSVNWERTDEWSVRLLVIQLVGFRPSHYKKNRYWFHEVHEALNQCLVWHMI